MKLSRKLVMVSVAALMGVSPVLAAAPNAGVVQAATSSAHVVYGNKITATKTIHFVNNSGKKTSKKAYKDATYKIWRVKEVNGKYYYAIQSNSKYWIPATATKGTVTYTQSGKKVTLTSNGKTVTRKTSAKKTSTKKTAKKSTAKKSTTKKATKTTKKSTKKVSKKTSSKKTNKKKTAKKVSSTKLVTIRRTPVVDKNGKKVKTYMGSKKWNVLGKKVRVIGHGTKTIKGEKYYALDPSHFVKASDVKVVK